MGEGEYCKRPRHANLISFIFICLMTRCIETLSKCSTKIPACEFIFTYCYELCAISMILTWSTRLGTTTYYCYLVRRTSYEVYTVYHNYAILRATTYYYLLLTYLAHTTYSYILPRSSAYRSALPRRFTKAPTTYSDSKEPCGTQQDLYLDSA